MISYIHNNNHKFVVKWRLTTWCNYNCPYCFNTRLSEREKRLTPEKIILTRAEKINKIINESIKEKVSLQLLGGEVMWYKMDKILNVFKGSPYVRNIQITSNFSAPLGKYIALENKIYLLSLSYHDSQVEFDVFFDKLEELCKQVTYRIKVKFVANKDNDYLIQKIKDRVKVIGCKNVKVVIDNEHTLNGVNHNYSNSQKPKTEYSKKATFIVGDNSEGKLYFKSKSDVLNHYSGLDMRGYFCSGSMRNIEIIEDNIYDSKCNDTRIVGTLDQGFKKRIKHCGSCNCLLCGNISIDRDENKLKEFLKHTKQVPKKKKNKKS